MGDDMIRYVVCAPDGSPTGWAMGMTADHAIRNWLGGSMYLSKRQPSDEWVRERWAGEVRAGYSVRAFRLVPETQDAAIAEARRRMRDG